MAEPIIKRKWFRMGLTVLAVGVFTYAYASYQAQKYDALYPYLSVAENGLTPEIMKEKTPEEIQAPEINSKEDQKRDTERRMIYGLSRKYKLIGIGFAVLGILMMLASLKEPQVPELTEESDGDNGDGDKA